MERITQGKWTLSPQCTEEELGTHEAHDKVLEPRIKFLLAKHSHVPAECSEKFVPRFQPCIDITGYLHSLVSSVTRSSMLRELLPPPPTQTHRHIYILTDTQTHTYRPHRQRHRHRHRHKDTHRHTNTHTLTERNQILSCDHLLRLGSLVINLRQFKETEGFSRLINKVIVPDDSPYRVTGSSHLECIF